MMSVIKRLFGEYVTSKLIRTYNRELSFRRIAYNMHRLTNLVILWWFLYSQTRLRPYIRYSLHAKRKVSFGN